MQKKFISNDTLKEVLDLATDEEKLSLTKLLSENETEAFSSSKLQKEICKLDKGKGSYFSLVNEAINELNIKGLPSYPLVVKYYDEIDRLKYTEEGSRIKARNYANKADEKIILKVLENIYTILDNDKRKEFDEQINKVAKKYDSNISQELVGKRGLIVLGNLNDVYIINEFLMSVLTITSFTKFGIIALDKLKNKKIILIVAIIGVARVRIELDEIDKIMSKYKKNTKKVSKQGENNQALLKVKKEEDITIELAKAIHNSDLDKLGTLIKNGLDVNTQFSNGSTPLVYAFYFGSFDVIKLLINNGANTQDIFYGKYAGLLLFLISSNDVKTIHFLLDNGLNTNITINSIPLIVTLIFLGASDDMMELFFNYGIDINITYENISLLFLAIMAKSSTNTIDILVKNTPDLNVETVDDMPILPFALTRQAPLDIIEILIQHGADTNTFIGDVPLLCLTLFLETSLDIIDLLVSNGVDINAKMEEAQLLAMAVLLQSPEEIIDYFYENTNDIDFDMLLQAAIMANNTKMIEKLLQQKININKLNEDGNSHLQDILNDLISQGKNNFIEEKKIISSQNDFLYSMKKDVNNQKEKVKKIFDINIGNSYIIDTKIQDSLQKLHYEITNIFNTLNESFILTQEELTYTVTSKLYAIEEMNRNINSFINIFIKYGGDINNKNNFGDTALSIAYKGNDIETAKVLIQQGADVNIQINKNMTLYEATIMNQQQELQKLIENSPTFITQQHSPQRLVKLLSNFRNDTPIKYTTHIWDMNFKEDYGDFKVYLSRVKQQWNEIDKELNSLSPRLHTKIYNFLLNSDANSKSWCSKDGDGINIGWSSLKGLEEWCNDGNDPFNFQVEKPYKVNSSTITTFGEVITLFKQEIQMRNENNMLENIFIDIEEQLDDEFDGVFEFQLINLKGKTFYTDTEVFKSVLVDRIFKDITREERHKYNKIKVEIAPNTSSDYHELRIIQIGSQSNQSSQDMLHHHGADTSIIKKELTNLCDWSIESSSDTENYRINYLKSNTTLEDIEPLDYKPEGYTHIMRFYK